jgi:hypothetical protein
LSLARLFSLHGQLLPLINALSGLSDEDRPHACDNIVTLTSQWLTFLRPTTADKTDVRKLIAALFNRYSLEEQRLLSGTAVAGKHIIVTSFVTYSAFVDTLINEVLRLRPDKAVVCYTTLPMPLTRWFNFNGRMRENSLQYCELNDGWHDYTEKLRHLVAKERLFIKRCVLAVDDKWSEGSRLSEFAIRSEREMRAHCGAHIAIPKDGHVGIRQKLRPLVQSEIEKLFSSSAGTTLRTLYADVPRAYVILPEEIEPPSDTEGWIWVSLGMAFIEAFHTPPIYEHSLYRVFDESDIATRFTKGSSHEMPEDIFIIGEPVNGQDPHWLVCLAGDVSREGDRVSIEVITEDLNIDRFHLVGAYANWLFANTEKRPGRTGPLMDWLNP